MKPANQFTAESTKSARRERAAPVRHSSFDIRHSGQPAFSAVKKSASDYFAPSAPARIVHLVADVIPAGDGTYRLVPRKPRLEAQEISTLQVAKLLGLGITATKALRDSKLGQKLLRWRYSTEAMKVIKWELPSVLAFKEATRQIGK